MLDPRAFLINSKTGRVVAATFVEFLSGNSTNPSICFTDSPDSGLQCDNAGAVNYIKNGTNLGELGTASSLIGGSDTQIQFNNSGSFDGSADLTWDDTGKELGVGGDINLDDGGTYATTLQLITPTANRTISFPDATGTVALVGGSSGQLVYNNAGAYAGAPSTSVGATGNITLSLAGAASTPPVSLTGSWFSGGTSTTTKPQLLIEPNGTTSTAWSTSGTGLGVNAASGFGGRLFDFQINGSSKAVLDSAGRLLVGTSSSPSGGDAAAENATFIVSGRVGNSTDSGRINLQRGSSATGSQQIGVINFTDSSNNAYARLAATADGVTGTGDYPGCLVFSTTADGASSPTERMRITNSGRVMIGGDFTASSNTTSYIVAGASSTSTGNLAFESVTGSAALRYHMAFSNPNGVVGGVTTDGSATAFNTSSDYRLKENVTAVTDGITRLQQLKPSRFNFIADPTKTVDGFLAHEVQDIVPEAISGKKDAVDEDGNPQYQGIDQSKLVPLLTAALQEAVAKIETLEANNTDLLARVTALESA